MPQRSPWNLLGLLTLTLVPAVGQAQAHETHTVRHGDTLWDLARQYRNDPFLWPDLYRLNTAVVEDPHWIYPGEVLRLSDGADVASVPSVDTPVPADAGSTDSGAVVVADAGPAAGRGAPNGEVTDAPSIPLFATRPPQSAEDILKAYTDQPYRALRKSEFYSSGFLTEGQKLPFGRMLGPVTPQQIRSVSSHSSAQPFSTVAIAAPSGATYRAGDTLLVAQLGPKFEEFGEAVVPTGLVTISGESDGRYLGTVIAVYGPLRNGQLVLPAEPFGSAGRARAVPVADGVRGTMLGGPTRQDLKVPQMIVFLDRGRAEGVAAGDIFEARRTPARLADQTLRVDELMATLQVVHVRAHSATARVLNVIAPDLPSGTTVRQVAKLPS